MLMLLLAVPLLAVALSACGSGGGDSTTAANSTAAESGTETGEESTASESGGSEASEESGAGALTLEELYAGEEEKVPTSSPPIKKNVSLVFVSCGQEAPGCAAPAQAMEEAAAALGWKFRITDAKLNANNGQQRAVREATALDPDVIVLDGMGCPDVTQPLNEAKAQGIAVMGIEDVDCGDVAGGDEDLFDVEMIYNQHLETRKQYYTVWGERQASYAVDVSEGKGKIMLLPYLGSFGELISQGWENVFSKCGECEIVDELPFASTEEAPNGPLFQKFGTALLQHPEAEVLISPFDTPLSVSGVAQAVVEAGRAEDLTVIGGEGSQPALEAIIEEKGVSADANAHASAWSAWGAADEINRFLNEEEAVPEGLGFIAVDKEHNMPPKGNLSAVYETEYPFRKEYEKIWNAG
jgi:ribose transport system substrate-binding protein